MKTPTWAIVIAICLMLFGSCSVTKSIQAINMPQILEMQQKMMKKMAGEKSKNSTDSLSTSGNKDAPDADMFKNMAEGMQEMFVVSEFTKTWTVRFGYIGILVALLYILSGVFLIIKKAFSIKLVYVALVTSILFSAIQSIVLASDSSSGLLAKSAGFTNIFGIIIDIILIVIVLAMDKSTYFNYPEKIA